MTDNYSEENPLGGTIDRYDIAMEQELIDQEEKAEKQRRIDEIQNQERKWGEKRK